MRTDIHRKGAIVPTDYRYVMSYSLSTTQHGWVVPSYSVNCILDTNHAVSDHTGDCCVIGMHADPSKKFATHGHTGKCTICGAVYIYGDIWQHIPTGEYIHVGHDCADKMHTQDRRAFEHGRVAHINRQKRQQRLEQFCADNDGMAEVLALYEKSSILADMRNKVLEWGNLSEKQIAFAKKLAYEILNPPVKAPILELSIGKQTVTGTFVSRKQTENAYGYVEKGLFLVTEGDKVAKIWMTVPRYVPDGLNVPLTIKVTLSKGSEAGFYFGSRPSIAQKIYQKEALCA